MNTIVVSYNYLVYSTASLSHCYYNYTRQAQPMRRLENFKKIDTQMDQPQNKITEILTLLGELYDTRLVEKMGRPWSYLQKERLYIEYRQKFQALHQLLWQLQRQYHLQLKQAAKNSQNSQTMTIKNKYHKMDIVRIEQRYSEVLIQGSFRYYYKVAKVFGLPTDLYAINIQQWANETLKDDPENKCC